MKLRFWPYPTRTLAEDTILFWIKYRVYCISILVISDKIWIEHDLVLLASARITRLLLQIREVDK